MENDLQLSCDGNQAHGARNGLAEVFATRKPRAICVFETLGMVAV